MWDQDASLLVKGLVGPQVARFERENLTQLAKNQS
jgi:hypothetical protein